MHFASRQAILPEPELPRGSDLLAEGAAMARDWQVGPSAFLSHVGEASEHAYKMRRISEGAVMQHAQIGYRDRETSIRAYRDIWQACERQGVRVDRYGLCLDWSMALPRATRARGQRGTGMLLSRDEDFIALANAAPVAPHFGDFVLGFPAAIENTCAALAAGSTAIGNLGQYFTFRVPGHDDDVETTAATVTALGLIAAQPVPVIVHSNIDDGFAAQYTDLASCLGQILIESDLVTRLVGAPVAHCFGHHFSDPLARLAFQKAMAAAGCAPGTVIYGNTTSYRGSPAQNYASLASYLLVDCLGQRLHPTGHAINAVPVTENERIPEIGEVIDAQLFAGELKNRSASWPPLIAPEAVDTLAQRIHAGGRAFRDAVLQGMIGIGIDTDDIFEMLLALRRIGARRLEAAYGAGPADPRAAGGRVPLVAATVLAEVAEMAEAALRNIDAVAIASIRKLAPKILVATSDVHEHGKLLIEEIARRVGAQPLDGGVSTDPGRLAQAALATRPDVIAISTYNGVALRYFTDLRRELREVGLIHVPVLIGGRLNQIPEGSNTSLPVDVGCQLAEDGAIVCREARDLPLRLVHLIGRSPHSSLG